MIIFIDENLPPKLAQGLSMLESANTDAFDVHSIRDYFKKGSPDEGWIPEIGRLGGAVITQDHNIHRKQMQKDLYRKHKVGLIVFKAPGKNGYTYWEMVENIVKHWQLIKTEIRKHKPPFAFMITPRSSKLLPL
ncbi:MAG: hypothetical protein ACTHMD_16865 [Flavisolibacter sp.]